MGKRLAKLLVFAVIVSSCACSSMGYGARRDSPLSPKDSDWPAIPEGQGLDARVIAADAGLLAYLAAFDGVESYSSTAVTEAERGLIAEQYRRLPEKLRAVLDTRVVALVLVDSFIGNGIADFLRIDGFTVYPERFIVFVNRQVLKASATERLSQREASMFRPEPGAGSVRVVVKQPDASGAMVDAPALWYVLAHEGSHVLDYVTRVTPEVEPCLPEVSGVSADPADYPLCAGVWKGYGAPEAAADYPMRPKQKFWGLAEADLSVDDAAALYDELSSRPFASAYGATCWAEDWAELSTWYQNRALGGVFEVRLIDAAGAVVKSWRPHEGAAMAGRLSLARAILE